MRLHFFNINERDRDRNLPLFFFYRRFFWTWYKGIDGAEREVLSAHLETPIRKKPETEFSFRFHVGSNASETPFDGHATILGSGFYWGISRGRRLANWLTSQKEKYSGRDFSLSLFHGRIRWEIWVKPHETKTGEFAKWRQVSFPANPIEWFLGPKLYSYKDLAKAPVDLRMFEGTYPAVLTLQECTLKRVKSKRVLEKSLTVDVDVPKGIPTHVDHSGGWKGDRTYGFGVKFPLKEDVNYAEFASWVNMARQLAESRVLEWRGVSGFTKPDVDE
jgi:hypothetical protein